MSFHDDPSARARFLEENHDFWAAEPAPGPEAAHVVIDLCHPSPPYLLANLVAGKYLARMLGARTLGVTARTWSSWTHYDRREIHDLARSYRLDAVLDLEPSTPDDATGPPHPDASILTAALREPTAGTRPTAAAGTGNVGTRNVGTGNVGTGNVGDGVGGAALRSRLLETSLAGNPGFGRCAYDTVLRRKLAATIDRVDEDVECTIDAGVRWDETIRAIYANLPVAATVLGHLEYLPYGCLARASIDRGAPVYHQWPCVPVTLRRSRTHRDLDHGLASDFVDAYRERILPHLERDEAGLERFRRGFSRRFRRIRSVRQRAGLADGSDAREMLRRAGLDSSRPKLAILCHSFADSVHIHGGLLYHDFGQWILGTLEIAARHPEIDFVVKPHPAHRSYDADRFLDRLRDSCADVPNVGFLRPEDSIDPLIPGLAGAVTAHGSPGYELALAGVPTGTVGRTRYEGLGIADRMESTDEYARWIAAVGTHGSRPERRRAALAFAAFETVAGRSRAALLPDADTGPPAVFWTDATTRLHTTFVDEDPLWRNLRAMVEEDVPFLTNLDWLEARAPLGALRRPGAPLRNA